MNYEILNPKCPKCGNIMSGGAPHGEDIRVQWECHRCGKIVTSRNRITTMILTIFTLAVILASCKDSIVGVAQGNEQPDRPDRKGFIQTEVNKETYYLTRIVYDPITDVFVFYNREGFELACFREACQNYQSKAIYEYGIMVQVNNVVWVADAVGYDLTSDEFDIDGVIVSRDTVQTFEYWQVLIKEETYATSEIYKRTYPGKRYFAERKDIHNKGICSAFIL